MSLSNMALLKTSHEPAFAGFSREQFFTPPNPLTGGTLGSLVEPLYQTKKQLQFCNCLISSGKRDSNSRPQPWQGCALPTELFPHFCGSLFGSARLAKVGVFTPFGARLCSTDRAISAFSIKGRLSPHSLHEAKPVLRLQR